MLTTPDCYATSGGAQVLIGGPFSPTPERPARKANVLPPPPRQSNSLSTDQHVGPRLALSEVVLSRSRSRPGSRRTTHDSQQIRPFRSSAFQRSDLPNFPSSLFLFDLLLLRLHLLLRCFLQYLRISDSTQGGRLQLRLCQGRALGDRLRREDLTCVSFSLLVLLKLRSLISPSVCLCDNPAPTAGPRPLTTSPFARPPSSSAACW